MKELSRIPEFTRTRPKTKLNDDDERLDEFTFNLNSVSQNCNQILNLSQESLFVVKPLE
jgi:hypothetical protein